MKTVIIELPDGRDEALSITAIGRLCNNQITNIHCTAFDLSKGTHLVWNNDKQALVQYHRFASGVEGEKMSIKNLIPGDTVYVVHNDHYCSGSGISGFMFLANVNNYVIASCFANCSENLFANCPGTLSETLQYNADETQEEGYTELVVFPEKSCYFSREDALAALELEMEEGSELGHHR